MNTNDIEERYDIPKIAGDIVKEMKEDENDADAFDDYWHQIGLALMSRGFDGAEIKVLEGLVQKKVEELFNI